MKCEVREICGDWALAIFQYPEPKKPTIVFFNSRQNAFNVKRIIEVDDSIPNAATVCDMQEVVRCKDCRYCTIGEGLFCEYSDYVVNANDFCSYGEREKGQRKMTDKYDFMSVIDDIFKECKTISDVNFRFMELQNTLIDLFNQNIALKVAEDKAKNKR